MLWPESRWIRAKHHTNLIIIIIPIYTAPYIKYITQALEIRGNVAAPFPEKKFEVPEEKKSLKKC